jgi:hypothetical protein
VFHRRSADVISRGDEMCAGTFAASGAEMIGTNGNVAALTTANA